MRRAVGLASVLSRARIRRRASQLGIGETAIMVLVASAGVPQPRTSASAVSCALVATVADANTNAPVTDADVAITDLAKHTRTNWIGEVVIADLPAGRHTVQVRRVGYAAARVDLLCDRDTVGVFFRLEPQSTSLDTVRTIGKTSLNPMIQEFEFRRRMGIGRFLGDSILKVDSMKPVAEIIERRIPGMRSIGNGRTVQRFGCDTAGGYGSLDVYIDGARTSPSPRAPDATDLRLFEGRYVAGVEIYSATNAPVQYRHLGLKCGVLLIWTRNY